MTNNILAFDLEIVTPLPDDGDWHYKGLGISIAVAYHLQDVPGFDEPQGIYETWLPPRIDCDDGGYYWQTRIPSQQVVKIVQYLSLMQSKGYKLVTWNGVGFDFPFIQEHLGQRPLWKSIVKQLALRSYDACFQLVCECGFGIELEAACQGFGLGGKLEGMHGSIVPEMWSGVREDARREELREMTAFAPGSAAAQRRVLEYAMQDAEMTYQVYEQIMDYEGSLCWINYHGHRSSHRFRLREFAGWPIATAGACRALPEPDTEWMGKELRERFARGKFTRWLEEG